MLEEVARAVDKLGATDPVALADGETVQALHRELERLTAVTTRAAAAFDASRVWEADGARSAAGWIAGRCGQPLGAARRRVRLGRALRSMPATEAAWMAGDVGEADVELLARTRHRVGAERFDPDERLLVEHARTLDHRDFVRVLAYWTQHADPDGADADAEAQRDARRLHHSQSLDGMWFGDWALDPLSGEAVANVLGAIERELFEADWAEAKRAKGEAVRAGDLARTSAQRRADALVEMAMRAASAPAGGRRRRC